MLSAFNYEVNQVIFCKHLGAICLLYLSIFCSVCLIYTCATEMSLNDISMHATCRVKFGKNLRNRNKNGEILSIKQLVILKRNISKSLMKNAKLIRADQRLLSFTYKL